jgi:adrenodoxin-NADP+ reductase
VKNVYLVGRRGPLQAAYTIKELREMLKLPKVDTVWRPNDFVGVPEQIEKLPRPKKRIAELMVRSLSEAKIDEGNRKFLPVFFRSPVEVNDDSVDFTVTKLENDKAVATTETESLPAQLVCRSIGYKSINVDAGINFDDKRGRVKNIEGRVLLGDSQNPDPGLYVAGWLATGPSGVILTTMNSSFAVAHTIVNDIQSGAVKFDAPKPGLDVKNRHVVTWSDWGRIDKQEVENGRRLNKPREKIVSVEEMLKIVN